MQAKTIKKTIKNKLNEWLQTIPKNIREDVKNNIVVSGGSICSLFLKEQVNDYDIYLQDIEVLRKLTNFYTEDFGDIIVLDGREKETILKNESERLGIKGVSIQNLKDNQIKLYFNSKNGGIKVNESVEKEKLNYTPLFFSPNAISLSNDIQIVLRFNGTVEEIHKTFDFIHATNYFTFKDGLVTNTKALESLLSKQLYYQGSQYPITSIIRIKKFLKKGWNISAGEMLKIMFEISELNLSNISTLEEQLIGVDVAYFGVLIEILRNKLSDESFILTVDYLKALIDRVFDEEDL